MAVAWENTCSTDCVGEHMQFGRFGLFFSLVYQTERA
jgi:hypothetical protein